MAVIYLSKGLPVRYSDGTLTISHRGAEFALTGERAEVWERGRCGFHSDLYGSQFTALREIAGQGLAETSEDTANESFFRLMTNCVICPMREWNLSILWEPLERTVWQWISKAGLRLTIAELVFLIEKKIKPTPGLLGEANRQALTEAIYTKETIFDGILESRMEQSPARDITVKAVLGLARKKKVILI